MGGGDRKMVWTWQTMEGGRTRVIYRRIQMEHHKMTEAQGQMKEEKTEVFSLNE